MTDSPSPRPPSPTPLCAIITAVIRILAIKFGLDAVGFLLSALAGIHASPTSHNNNFIVVSVIVFGVLGVCTYWLWQLSPFLARHITRGQDPSLATSTFTLFDLYSFAFLLTGLYFALDSLGPSLTWLHYSVSQSSSVFPLSPQQQGNYYTLFKYLVRLILGLALIFNGRKFATKLIKRHDETVSGR